MSVPRILEETSIQKTKSRPFLSTGDSLIPTCGPEAAKISVAIENTDSILFNLTLPKSIFSNKVDFRFSDKLKNESDLLAKIRSISTTTKRGRYNKSNTGYLNSIKTFS